MVTVPRSSIDQVKFITEHDILKFVGTVATALLVPLMMWSFISLHSTLGVLSDKVTELHEQVAVIRQDIKSQREYISAEFDVSKSQVRAVGEIVKDFRAEAGELARSIGVKAAKRK